MATDTHGWLLDLYPDEQAGAVVWLLGDDGLRRRFVQPFPVTFYLGGEADRRADAGAWLAGQAEPPELATVTRRDLFAGPQTVLAVQAASDIQARRMVAGLRRRFRRLNYYDIDIPFSVRFLAANGVFPTARVSVTAEGDRVLSIRALDDPWDFQFDFPPVRTLHIQPECDPQQVAPRVLRLIYGDTQRELPLADPRRILEELIALFAEYDPDLLLCPHGDAWLFSRLFEWAEQFGVPFQPNRDPNRDVLQKKAFRFYSYGDVHHRAGQTHLFGRWHIDPHNTSMFGGFSLAAALELARVTGVGVQTAARSSPGAGFTALQMAEALRRGILIPFHKRQVEPLRSAQAFHLADRGGLNYRPLVGLHYGVAELDFFSMYPQIMAVWNISGETVGQVGRDTRYVPQTEVPITQDEPGLVATVLKPVLSKRRKAKLLMREIPKDDPRWPLLEAAAEGLKWLGWVSFGYQGFKNNRFGHPQAHEAICAVGREVLTTAKETAFRLGFQVLAANTDSLFVQQQGATEPGDFQELLEAIQRDTGLVLNLEGVFEWLAFVPAKGNPRVGAANRYFGKFADGTLKIRGLAQRRGDTPAWIARAEADALALLAGVPRHQPLNTALAEIVALVQKAVSALQGGRVPLEDLVVWQKLTREPDEYRGLSASAASARQLRIAGKDVQVGQRVGFVYIRGRPPAVRAWGLAFPPALAELDHARYRRLLTRALHGLLVPLGLDETAVQSLVADAVRQLELWPSASNV